MTQLTQVATLTCDDAGHSDGRPPYMGGGVAHSDGPHLTGGSQSRARHKVGTG